MEPKLLVVDDEIEVCDFVRNFFAERKFEVFTAYNGKEALSLIEMMDPHIVLLDIKMPILDGIQTLKEITKRGKRAKVIMLTAVEDRSIAEEARLLGAVGYITKPLSLENLEKSVVSLAESIKFSQAKS